MLTIQMDEAENGNVTLKFLINVEDCMFLIEQKYLLGDDSS
jgi:hypothetical protein